jgi:DoxX
MENLRDPRLSSSYWALRVTFIAVPLLAGLDKFTNLLTYWPHYVSPAFARLLPMTPVAFMHLVGIVEIAVGLLVLTKATRVGAYIAMVWLACIAVNLASMSLFDIAVRDLGLAVGAFALARLQEVRSGVPVRAHVHRTATATT